MVVKKSKCWLSPLPGNQPGNKGDENEKGGCQDNVGRGGQWFCRKPLRFFTFALAFFSAGFSGRPVRRIAAGGAAVDKKTVFAVEAAFWTADGGEIPAAKRAGFQVVADLLSAIIAKKTRGFTQCFQAV